MEKNSEKKICDKCGRDITEGNLCKKHQEIAEQSANGKIESFANNINLQLYAWRT